MKSTILVLLATAAVIAVLAAPTLTALGRGPGIAPATVTAPAQPGDTAATPAGADLATQQTSDQGDDDDD